MLKEQRPFISVVVTCHPDHYKYLSEAVACVERQTRSFDLKVLVFDLASAQEAPSIQLPQGWQMITGAWNSDNEARNAGLRRVTSQSQWVAFFDATHRCAPDYVEKSEPILRSSKESLGIVYPDVTILAADGQVVDSSTGKDWDGFIHKETTLCSTASFWSVLAMNEVGGWSPSQVGYESYEMALRLSRSGWVGAASKQCVKCIRDTQNRNASVSPLTALWDAWTFAFVTLWGGNLKTEHQLLEWYETADVPPNSVLYWVDNSQGRLKGLLTSAFLTKLSGKFKGLVYIDAGAPFQIDPEASYFHFQRHTHVANLYNRVLTRISEDMVVTVEDDMVPPKDGLRTLMGMIRPNGRVAMATGVYRARTNPEHICAATGRGMWLGVHLYDKLPLVPFEVGMSGGGFAVFASWALQKSLPVRCTKRADGYMLGWDGNLGNSITGQGYKMLAHPDVKCEHLCPEVLDYLKGTPQAPSKSASKSIHG